MANFELIGLPNQAALSTSTVTAATAAAGFPAANLQGDEPSVRWRSSSNLPRATVLYWATAADDGVECDRVALVGSNLGAGSALVRVLAIGSLLTSSPADFDRQVALPVNLAGASNCTGAYTDIDEGFTPDGAWIGATSASSSWSVRVLFDESTGTLAAGAYRQQFWCYVRGTSSTAGHPHSLTAELWENGAKVADLGRKAVLSATGQWVVWAWDAAELSLGGAKTELKVTGQRGVAAGAVELGSAVWLYERTADVDDLLQVVADSGWQAVPVAEASTMGAPGPEDAIGGRAVVVEVPAPSGSIAGRRGVYVLVAEDHAPLDVFNAEAVATEPPGYVEAGVLVVGRAWSPARGIPAQGEFLRVVDPSVVQRTPGGQTFGVRRRPYREVMLSLGALTAAEARALVDRLLLRHGARRPVLVRVLPDDSAWAEVGTVWAELVEAAAIGGAPAPGRLRGALTLREKL